MAVFFFIFLTTAVMVDSLKLEQVFVLSRHNIRAPLSNNLERTTSQKWPLWDVPVGHLTEKGSLLEEIMGNYFADWFEDKQLFTGECPDPDSVYVYSNNKQRTIQTAKIFARAAFKDCNIDVHFNLNKEDSEQSDPVFAPFLRNNTESFKDSYYRLMNEKLLNAKLEDAYDVLNEIVNVKHSDICKYDSFCDFNMRTDDILYAIGEEPNIFGPLSIGNFIADFFLMSYYNGWPEKQIAWGKIDNEEEWKKLLDITRENQNVRFNQTLIAKDVARPLLNYMRDAFLNEKARKLTVLVGHDSNLNSVMAALGFKKYNLPGQYEYWPIGGKLVFQKWRDENSNFFLKIEYIYESMEQLRNETVLTRENPPFSQIMELQNCEIDENGFCPWDDFVNIAKTLY